MRKNSTPSERLKEVLSIIGVSPGDFEDTCKMGHGFVSRVTHVITKKNRERIQIAYPEINIEYITHGRGEMFLKEKPEAKPTIKERIKQFCFSNHIPEAEFCRRAGLANSFIRNMSDNVRNNSLEKIYRVFPRLNPVWLEYGEGEMLAEPSKKKPKNDGYERIMKLIEFLGVTKAQFASETNTTEYSPSSQVNITKKTADKIAKRYPFVNPQWLLHGTGAMTVEKPKPMMAKLSFAPLVSQRAYAGYLNGLEDSTYVEELEKIPYLENEDTRGNIIAFEVSGDSMDDGTFNSYKDGDVVLCRELFLSDYKTMTLPFRHYDFVIVHKEGILIKQIMEHDTEKGVVTLHSLNSFYGDVEVRLEDLRKVFVIVTKISKMRH